MEPQIVTENNEDPFLTPGEVAALFRVDPKTVSRWAKAGKLARTRTIGGHGRYRQSDVIALMCRNEA
jgi:excisionase family DNA binding protein